MAKTATAVEKAAKLEASFQTKKKVNAVLLSTYLSEEYSNDEDSFSKATGHQKSKLKSWLEKDAVVAGGHIFLEASKFAKDEEEKVALLNKLDEGMKVETLALVLDKKYGGSQGEFARKNKTYQQQVSRWANRGALVIDGHVYRGQVKLELKAKT